MSDRKRKAASAVAASVAKSAKGANGASYRDGRTDGPVACTWKPEAKEAATGCPHMSVRGRKEGAVARSRCLTVVLLSVMHRHVDATAQARPDS